MRHYINGVETVPFNGWKDVVWRLSFENDGLQADTSIENIMLIGKDFETCYDWIFENGNGFLGLPYKVVLENPSNIKETLEIDGYLHNLAFDTNRKIATATFTKRNDVYSFSQTISLYTFSTLYNEGFVKDFIEVKSIKLPVDLTSQRLQVLTTTFMISMQLAMTAQMQFDTLQKNITSVIDATVPPFPVWRLVSAILVLGAQIAMLSLMLVQLAKMINELIDLIYPPATIHKACTYRTLLNAVLDKMKMKLSTNLKELDAVYLPSDFTNQGVKRGIPELGDYGHNCIDLLDLIKRNSGCLISVTNETLYMYKKNDPFWVKTSNYILEDVEQLSQFTTNIEKISATKFVRFARDSSNEWTSANYKGTGAVESITPTNKGISLLYGFEEEEMPICLPSTYDKLTEIDYAIKNLLKVADSFSSVLGGDANFGKKFKSRFGAIKFSSDIHTMPYHLVSYPLPKNHRDLYNANIILENSNNYVSDNFANQEILFENKTIPLSTEDFFKIASNSTFTIKDGRVGRFKGSLEFNAEKKQALCLFAINSILSVKLNRDVYE